MMDLYIYIYIYIYKSGVVLLMFNIILTNWYYISFIHKGLPWIRRGMPQKGVNDSANKNFLKTK